MSSRFYSGAKDNPFLPLPWQDRTHYIVGIYLHESGGDYSPLWASLDDNGWIDMWGDGNVISHDEWWEAWRRANDKTYTVSNDRYGATCDWHIAFVNDDECPVRNEADYLFDHYLDVGMYFYLCSYHHAIVRRDNLVEIVPSLRPLS